MKKAIIMLLALVSLKSMAAQSCDYQEIRNEVIEMRRSPYWSQLAQQFADDMNTKRPRGCSFANEQRFGFDIFMDDLEFTGATDSSRVLAYHGTYGTYYTSSSDQFNAYPTDDNLFQANVIEFSFYLRSGFMVLNAKSCSPKVVLANLIAYTPYVMIARCNQNPQSGPEVEAKIQQKVTEILSNEPK